MNRLFFPILIFLFLSVSGCAQNLSWEHYLDNSVFYNTLGSNLSNYHVRDLKIESLTEWKHTLDSSGTIINSQIKYQYLFDDQGRLVERRRRFSSDGKEYVSIKYVYGDDGIDTIARNPYGVNILDGIYTRPIKECTTYNSNGFPATTDVEFEGSWYTFLHMEFSYLKWGLLNYAKVQTNRGNFEHEIKFTFHGYVPEEK